MSMIYNYQWHSNIYEHDKQLLTFIIYEHDKTIVDI